MHGPCRLSSMISESFLLVPVQDRHQAAPARIVPRSASEEKLRAKARECQHRRRRFAQIVPFARCFLRTPAEMRPDRRHRVLSAPPLLRDRTVRAPDWRPQILRTDGSNNALIPSLSRSSGGSRTRHRCGEPDLQTRGRQTPALPPTYRHKGDAIRRHRPHHKGLRETSLSLLGDAIRRTFGEKNFPPPKSKTKP